MVVSTTSNPSSPHNPARMAVENIMYLKSLRNKPISASITAEIKTINSLVHKLLDVDPNQSKSLVEQFNSSIDGIKSKLPSFRELEEKSSKSVIHPKKPLHVSTKSPMEEVDKDLSPLLKKLISFSVQPKNESMEKLKGLKDPTSPTAPVPVPQVRSPEDISVKPFYFGKVDHNTYMWRFTINGRSLREFQKEDTECFFINTDSIEITRCSNDIIKIVETDTRGKNILYVDILKEVNSKFMVYRYLPVMMEENEALESIGDIILPNPVAIAYNRHGAVLFGYDSGANRFLYWAKPGEKKANLEPAPIVSSTLSKLTVVSKDGLLKLEKISTQVNSKVSFKLFINGESATELPAPTPITLT